VRAPAARRFQPGALRVDGEGAVLRCLVLVPGPEWVAVDLESGALLRAPAGSGLPGEEGERSSPSERFEADDSAGERAGDHPSGPRPWPERTLSAVELTLGPDTDPADPARPEAVVLAGPPRAIGAPRRRVTRRLLEQITTKAADRPLLGTLGPSISYGDLDGTRPSVVIVAPQARPRFGVGPNGPWCQFALGGRRHTMPCAEGATPDAGVGGHSVKLLVVALGPPRGGQVPKVVLGTVPVGR